MSHPKMRSWLLSLMGTPRWQFIGACYGTGTTLDFSSLSAGAVAAGDLLVYIDGSQSGSAPAAVTPSGFSNRLNDNGVTFRGMVSVKKAVGGEASITGMTGSSSSKVGLVFRPPTVFTSINVLDITSDITTSNPAAQTCDPSAETVPAIVIGIADAFGGTGGFSTFSPSADEILVTPNDDMSVGYKIFETSPLSTTIDMNDLGANWLASLYITVTP